MLVIDLFLCRPLMACSVLYLIACELTQAALHVQTCQLKIVNTLLGAKRAEACTIGAPRLPVACAAATSALCKRPTPASPKQPATSTHPPAAGPPTAAEQISSAGVPAYGPGSYSHVPASDALANYAGGNVLHIAAAWGHAALVNQLIKSGAHDMLDQKTRTGFTPVALAAQAGHAPCVKALLAAKCDTACITGAGQTLLHLAVQCGDADVLKAVLGKGVTYGQQQVRIVVRALLTFHQQICWQPDACLLSAVIIVQCKLFSHSTQS